MKNETLTWCEGIALEKPSEEELLDEHRIHTQSWTREGNVSKERIRRTLKAVLDVMLL